MVQYSSAVQPHGALVAATDPDLRIVQVSANAGELFGMEAGQLLGRDLTAVLGERQTEQIRQRLVRDAVMSAPSVHVLRAAIGPREFHVFAHRTDQVLVFEFEGATPEQPVIDLYSEVRTTIVKLQSTESVQAFFNLAVEQIRHLTGFDRVMAYEFLPDGSGFVMAESIQPELTPYLGHHYPASDIPLPARRMFALTWLRHLPNVDYTPVPLVPEVNPVTNKPLDLTYVAGRHVSVMYSQYLRNMGVKATMVMTLLKNGQLWGLISCMQHGAPKHVPHEVRMACEFLTHMVSTLMATKEDVEVYKYKLKTNVIIEQLTEFAAHDRSILDGLVQRNPNLLSALDAQGAAVAGDKHVTTLGNAPTDAQIRELAGWLSKREEPIFVTDNLAGWYPDAEEFQDTASGLLAARLSPSGSEYMMWFRPEMVETVKWAGDPNKPVVMEQIGTETRLLPRTSFALWTEEVRGRSAPWRDFEVDAVRGLRRALLEIVVDRTAQLQRLAVELEKSKVELDSYTYAAGHDLKEPLRGIHNYSSFLKRTASDRLTDTEKARLETVLRLTQRMDDLIDGLLQCSRAGRIDLALQLTNLNEVMAGAVEQFRTKMDPSGITLQVADLPTVLCDRVHVREVFYNLIVNAVKYNDSAEKLVEIGYEPTSPPVFYVRDNGIGINAEHFDSIFNIFKRLHGRDEYGGGTGAGLTIARKTVERHGGRMWLESKAGEGSTFYFTLLGVSPVSYSEE